MNDYTFDILHINLGQDIPKFFPEKTKSLFHNHLTVIMWVSFNNENKVCPLVNTTGQKRMLKVQISDRFFVACVILCCT